MILPQQEHLINCRYVVVTSHQKAKPFHKLSILLYAEMALYVRVITQALNWKVNPNLSNEPLSQGQVLLCTSLSLMCHLAAPQSCHSYLYA